MEDSELKWVNYLSNIVGVNSFVLESLHIVFHYIGSKKTVQAYNSVFFCVLISNIAFIFNDISIYISKRPYNRKSIYFNRKKLFSFTQIWNYE